VKKSGITLPVGEHRFKGFYTKGEEKKSVEFIFNVEAGGVISSHHTEAALFNLNGIV